ncbi:hypothetical protein PI125_g17392 [Phytophthora idaei]|nr:hypothetical protein PI125_g17392 [Phytophthora idaei]
MIVFHWWDHKPVHYLCTGSAKTESTINRNVKRVGAISVPCPVAVNDYQRWIGGVDVHDQLRSNQKRKCSQLRLTHAFEQCEDWVTVSGVHKRRQRSCKVCLRTDRKKKSFATTFFCECCSVYDSNAGSATNLLRDLAR